MTDRGAEQTEGEAARLPRLPWWVRRGRVYRPVMRFAHWLGFCYPQNVMVEPEMVWCHWCGMRGRK